MKPVMASIRNSKYTMTIQIQCYCSNKCIRHSVSAVVTKARHIMLVVPLLAATLIESRAQSSFNVKDYGAVGDAVKLFVNTTSNSVIVTTTSPLSSADINKTIEIFGAGSITTAPNCEDMVATITNVVNGTNVYISQTAKATLSHTFATYGHNNTPMFMSVISACGTDTNDTIIIPPGTYLLLPTNHPGTYGYSALYLTSGGIHFVGAGIANTILLSQGAWVSIAGVVWRGFLVQVQSPIVSDWPVSFANMTMDGGVPNGNTGYHGYPANPVDGSGWDGTHDAYLTSGDYAPTLTHQTLSNIAFIHWRGEILKSIDSNTNGNLQIISCVFGDGNATAINIYPALDIENCQFTNLFQIAEYYQQYSTNISYFKNNFSTNITGNSFAVNGGKGNNPPFIIQGNVFYLASGHNGIETMPADNLFIINNQFICQDYSVAFALGANGYQGTFISSNIVILDNIVVNPFIFVELGGGLSVADRQGVGYVSVGFNRLSQPNHQVTLLQTYGWTTNVHFYNNDCGSFAGGAVYIYSGISNSPYALIETNNIYYTFLLTDNGYTNPVSYGSGSRYQFIYNASLATAYVMSDFDSNRIPAGAEIYFTNSTFNLAPVPIYLKNGTAERPIVVANGQSMSVYWNGSSWTTNPSIASPVNTNAPFVPMAPTGLHYSN